MRHDIVIISRDVMHRAPDFYKAGQEFRQISIPVLTHTTFKLTHNQPVRSYSIRYIFLLTTHPLDQIHNMSDASRQSFTDKAGSAMKPDSQKGTFEQAGDKIKGSMDNMASSVQPNVSSSAFQHTRFLNLFILQSQKSGSQKMGDSMTNSSSGNSVSLSQDKSEFIA